MILAKYIKQPSEVKDYDIDYGPWLTTPSDTLDDVTAAVVCLTDPQDTGLVVDAIQNTSTRAKFWLSGGTAGRRYKLTATATTVGGRLDESELVFTIKDY